MGSSTSRHFFGDLADESFVPQTPLEQATVILEKYAKDKVIIYGLKTRYGDIIQRIDIHTNNGYIVEYRVKRDKNPYTFEQKPEAIVVVSPDGKIQGSVNINESPESNSMHPIYNFTAGNTDEQLGYGGLGHNIEEVLIDWFIPKKQENDYPKNYGSYIPPEVHEYLNSLMEVND